VSGDFTICRSSRQYQPPLSPSFRALISPLRAAIVTQIKTSTMKATGRQNIARTRPSFDWVANAVKPPVGTEVFLSEGLVEIHDGSGIWQTVAA